MTALNTYRRWLARVEDDALRAELSTLDEVRQIQDDGRAKRMQAEEELGRIEGELKQKLLDMRG